MVFCRSKQSRKLGLTFLYVSTFRRDEGLYEAVEMQLLSGSLCSLSGIRSSFLTAPSWLRKGLSGCGFLPCRSKLSRWWISEACSSHMKARCEHFPSSVCGSSIRQATWQVEVVWDWSAAWCWGGKESWQLPEQPHLPRRGRSSLGFSLWLSTSAPTSCTNAAPLPEYKSCTGCSWWGWTWWIGLKLKPLFNGCC